MRLLTRERSWRNFWIVVAAGVAMTLLTVVFRPERAWMVAAFTALITVLLLVDSYLAGRRQRHNKAIFSSNQDGKVRE